MITLPSLQLEQVKKFSNLASAQPTTWTGQAPKCWANKLIPNLGTYYCLPRNKINRTDLRNIWLNRDFSTEACFLSTMAWGGMRYGNGRHSWRALSEWLPICDDIRAGKYTRKQGFEAFRNLRSGYQLPGMRPAYFTKILFFAGPTADAYILDQWTARSIHILTNQRQWPSVQQPPKSANAYVTDGVTASDYECYCLLVEQLARDLSLHPHSVEERMFGNGGRNPSLWRAYVRDNWKLLD